MFGEDAAHWLITSALFDLSNSGLKQNYDRERLKNDSDYRQKVLDKMAASTRSRWHYRRLLLVLQLILGITLFAAGIFLGGWLSWKQSVWATVVIVCLLIVPLMGWLLVTIRNFKQENKTSKMEIPESNGKTGDSSGGSDSSSGS